MPSIPTCTDCPHLLCQERRDFLGNVRDYTCAIAKEGDEFAPWIGFVAMRPEWCPLKKDGGKAK